MRLTPLRPIAVSLVALVVASLTAAAGCEAVPANNPFDPATPAPQQIKGRIEGVLVLPPGFAASALAESRVQARAAAAPAVIAADVTPEAEEADGAVHGRFVFPALTAGTYLIDFVVPGFGAPSQTAELRIAGAVDLGPIELVPRTAAVLEGVAWLAGDGVSDHSGISVSAAGTPYTESTSAEGLWRLSLPAGTYTLNFRYPGYGTEARTDVVAVADTVSRVDDEVVLSAAPGLIRGAVRLQPGYDDAERLATASIGLFAATDGPDSEPVATERPGEGGSFVFADVAPGQWRVTVTLTGFATESRTFAVAPGEARDAGAIMLFGAEFGWVTGSVQLAGASDHGGVRVDALGTSASTVTSADGLFRFEVVAGTHELSFSRDGYGIETLPAVEVEGNATTTLPDAVVLVGAPGSVAGTVALEPGYDGAVVVDTIEIDLRDASGEVVAQTRPDDTGWYLFDRVGAGRYTLDYALGGFVPELRQTDVRNGERSTLALVQLHSLPADASIAGTATLSGAIDHSGIRVEAVGTPHFALTQSEGYFQIRLPANPDGYRLTFRYEGYEGDDVDVRSLGPGEHLALEQPVLLDARPGRVRGLVVIPPEFEDPDLLGRVVVRLLRIDGEQTVEAGRATPSADGVYVIDDLGPGSYAVEISLVGFVTAWRQVTLSVGAEVEVEPAVMGVDLDGQRAWVSGVVRLSGRGDEGHGGVQIEAAGTNFVTQSSSTGAFRIEVSAGSYEFRFVREGYGIETTSTIALDPQEEVALEAPIVLVGEPGIVRGVVSLPPGFDDEDRLRAVTISLRTDDEAAERVAQENPNPEGLFVLGNVPAGDYVVEVALAGFQVQSQPVALEPGERVDLRQISLAIAEEEAPIVRGVARLAGVDALENGGIRVEMLRSPFVGQSTSEGQFEIRVVPGPATLRFSREQYQAREIDVELAPGEVLALEEAVTLPGEPGLVRGHVRLPPGYAAAELMAGVSVALVRGIDPAPVAETLPDLRGLFVLDAIAAGAYTLDVRLAGFEPASRPVFVEVGRASELGEIRLELPGQAAAAVEGTARRAGEGEFGHGGITVEVLGTPILSQTTRDGRFRLELPPGERELLFTTVGYGAQSLSVLVPENDTAVLDGPVILQGEPGRVRGFVRLPTGFDNPALLAQVQAVLTRDGEDEALAQVAPDVSGTFVFAGVPAGDYQVELALGGFAPLGRPVRVEVGATSDLGEVRLERLEEAAAATAIEGVAELAGAGEMGHGGIRVEIVGTPLVAQTASDGRFRIPALPGPNTLLFAYRAYASVNREVIVADGEVRELGASVLLSGQPGAIQGVVRLPAGFNDPGRYAQVAVALRAEEAPLGPDLQLGNPQGDGSFVFAGVAAGRYLVVASLAGFETAARPTAVEVGETVELGEVRLVLPTEDEAPRAVVEGTVRLAGAADGEHGGVRVEVVGTPFTAVTASDGRFLITVVPDSLTLLFSREGYASVNRQVLVAQGEIVSLGEPVLLAGAPGRIEGVVRLPPGFNTPVRLAQVTVALRGRDAPDGPDLQLVNPQGDGSFVIADVAASRYVLDVALAGFVASRRPFEVRVGAVSDLGELRLEILQEDEAITVIEGFAQLDGAAEGASGGIRVEVIDTPLTTVTASDGRFRLSVLPGNVDLRFSQDGYRSEERRFVVGEGEIRTIDEPIMLTGAPGAVTGVVRLPVGFDDPAQRQAVVVALRAAGTPDGPDLQTVNPQGDGSFLIADVAASRYVVDVSREGFVPVRRPFDVRVGATTDLGELRLELVVDEEVATVVEGTAQLAGAGVGAHGGIRVEVVGTPLTTVTASDGRFRMTVLPGALTLRFSRDGYGTEERALVLADGETLVLDEVVALSGAPGAVGGVVRLPVGFDDPAQRQAVVVALRAAGAPDGPDLQTVNPQGDGSFLIADVAASRYVVDVSREGFVPVRRPFDVRVGATTDLGELRLELVVDEEVATVVEGTAQLAGAGVGAHGGIRVEVVGTPLTTVTASDGRFRMTVLPGALTLRFSRDGYGTEERALVLADGETLVLDEVVALAGAPGAVAGVVRLPVGFDDPAQRQAVVVALRAAGAPDGPDLQTVNPQGDGGFLIADVAASRYVVDVSREGFVSVRRPFDVRVGATTDLGELRLELVVDEEVATVVEGTAQLAGAGPGAHGGIRVEVVGTPLTTVTASDGRFRMTVLPGALTLRFSRDGYGTEERALVLADGETLVLDEVVALAGAPGAVGGVVRLPVGFDDPAQRQAVVVALRAVGAPDGPDLQTVNPQGDGSFLIADVAASRYVVDVSREGFVPVRRPFDVRVGATTDLGELRLELVVDEEVATVVEGTAQLAGAGVGAHGGIRVEVVGTPLTTVTASDGRFRMTVLPGALTLRFSRDGYGTEERALVLADGETLVLDEVVALSGAPGAVIGVVRLPPGFEDPLQMQQVVVALRAGGAPDGPDLRVASPLGDGSFVIANVAASRYAVDVSLAGFVPARRPFDVHVGTTTDLGEIRLELDVDEEVATIVEGMAERSGAADGEHGGIRVEVVGTPLTTVTASDGRFRMTVVPGPITLRLSDDGYTTEERALVLLDGETRVLVETIALAGRPGTVEGIVRLPAGFNDPARLLQVSLVLRDDVDSPGPDLRAANPSADGAFVFADVPARRYGLIATLAGFEPARRPFAVEIGARVDLGEVRLDLIEEEEAITAVEGVVERQGAGAGGHGGIRVEVVGTPLVTQTSSDGRFRLVLPPGNAALLFSADGYAAVNRAIVVGEGETLNLGDPVVLAGEPGRIGGVVRLPVGFDDPVRLQLVRLGLRAAATPDGPDLAVENPQADGAFLFEGVAAALYVLDIQLAGFDPVRRPLDVRVGAITALGEIRLELLEAPQTAIEGTVQLGGAGDGAHGGSRIEVVGTPLVAQTTSNGRFRLDVPPGPLTLLFSHTGYTAVNREVIVADGEILDLGDPIVLAGEPGSIVGVVRLPVGFNDAARLGAVDVELARASEPDGAALQLAHPAADGTFLLDTVAAGDYVVRLEAEGFAAVRRPAPVTVGERTDLGEVRLELDQLSAGIGGVAQLQGVSDPNGHGGILIESVGTPFSTVTSSSGAWRLDVLPGEHTLSFRFDGYGTQILVINEVPIGPPDYAIADPTILPAQPGTVRGSVSLQRFGSVERLEAAAVELIDGDGAVADSTNPGVDGRFTIANVGAGDYSLRVRATGYETASRLVTVPVGETLEAGHYDLRHLSDGPSTVNFTGRVAVSAGDSGGTLVRVRLANPDLAFRVATTDADGGFELPAAPDESYRVTIERAGYQVPVLADTYSWDAGDGRFEDGDGDPVDVSLSRAPVNGTVTVPVRIEPSWLPIDEQYVRVAIRGADFDDAVEQVANGESAVFNNVPAGTFVLTASRTGFTNAQVVVTLDHTRDTVIVPEMVIALENLAAAQLDLSPINLDACDLRTSLIDLAGADLSGVTLVGNFGDDAEATCPDCVLCDALDLSDTNLTNANLTGATSFANVDLRSANLFGAQLAGVNLTGAKMNSTNLFGADMRTARLARANLSGANLSSADLSNAEFVDGDDVQPSVPCGEVARPGVNLTGVNFAQANLTEASMAGVDLSGSVLSSARLIRTDLSKACLARAILTLLDLTDADFDGADLTGAQLTSSILLRTWLRNTALADVSLTGAVIEAAEFGYQDGTCDPYPWRSDSDLTYDEMCQGDARFTDPRCCRTELDGANLNGANLVGAIFTDVDLTGASMLGVTLGQLDEQPAVQPSSCDLEVWNDCYDTCQAMRACELLVVPPILEFIPECDVWVPNCARGIFDIGFSFAGFTIPPAEIAAIRTCMANGYAENACTDNNALLICFDAENRPDYPAREPPCTFDDLVTPVPGEECPLDRVPETCSTTRTTLAGARLQRTQLTAVTVNGVDLSNANMRDSMLRGALILSTTMPGADLTGANLNLVQAPDGDLSDIDLTNANVSQSDLVRVTLRNTVVTGARFTESDMRGAAFVQTVADQPALGDRVVDFEDADLQGARFERASLLGADFTDANLDGASFERTSFAGANFENASMRDTQYQCIDFRGAAFEGTVFAATENFEQRSYGGGAAQNLELYQVDFSGADLSYVRFGASDVQGGRFVDTIFRYADLRGAEFRSGGTCNNVGSPIDSTNCDGEGSYDNCYDFTNASFFNTYMNDAEMSGGLYAGTDFRKAVLPGVRFSGSRLHETIWTDSSTEVAYDHDVATLGYSIDFQEADFADACLLGMEFLWADFREATFNGATMNYDAPACARVCEDNTSTFGTFNQAGTCEVEARACNRFDAEDCAELRGSRFREAVFTNADLHGIDAEYGEFSQAVATDTDFSSSRLDHTNWWAAQLTNVDFSNSNLRYDEVGFEAATVTGGTFAGASLRQGSVERGRFCGVDFTGVDFVRVNAEAAIFGNGTNCAGSNLTDAFFYHVSGGGAADLGGMDGIGANFTRVDFTNADLEWSDLNDAILRDAIFDGAFAQRTDLHGANLSGARFDGTDLRRACGIDATTISSTTSFDNAHVCSDLAIQIQNKCAPFCRLIRGQMICTDRCSDDNLVVDGGCSEGC